MLTISYLSEDIRRGIPSVCSTGSQTLTLAGKLDLTINHWSEQLEEEYLQDKIQKLCFIFLPQ